MNLPAPFLGSPQFGRLFFAFVIRTGDHILKFLKTILLSPLSLSLSNKKHLSTFKLDQNKL